MGSCDYSHLLLSILHGQSFPDDYLATYPHDHASQFLLETCYRFHACLIKPQGNTSPLSGALQGLRHMPWEPCRQHCHVSETEWYGNDLERCQSLINTRQQIFRRKGFAGFPLKYPEAHILLLLVITLVSFYRLLLPSLYAAKLTPKTPTSLKDKG